MLASNQQHFVLRLEIVVYQTVTARELPYIATCEFDGFVGSNGGEPRGSGDGSAGACRRAVDRSASSVRSSDGTRNVDRAYDVVA